MRAQRVEPSFHTDNHESNKFAQRSIDSQWESIRRQLQNCFPFGQASEDECSGFRREFPEEVTSGENVLTETESATGVEYPDAGRSRASARPQDESIFFRLPCEAREPIYRQPLRSAGDRQHIFVADGGYTHTRCVVDEDEGGSGERQVGLRRLMAGARTINHHRRGTVTRRCEERAAAETNGLPRQWHLSA
ncbi:hypothetical protein LX36DRAFT_283690 [Colletotrichum falcatum]|nr:hypothetical protein LX36DRAFT_283690 [Colletotrichum falcatum]